MGYTQTPLTRLKPHSTNLRVQGCRACENNSMLTKMNKKLTAKIIKAAVMLQMMHPEMTQLAKMANQSAPAPLDMPGQAQGGGGRGCG